MNLTSRIRALLDYANEKTEAGDTTLSEAVKTLADGYRQGGDSQFKYSGTNVELVATYDEHYTLADTSFVIGESASTSAVTIKATVSNRFVTPTLALGDKDIIVVQTVKTTPTHGSGATNTARMIGHAARYVYILSKRKTTPTSNNTTRQSYTIASMYTARYYGSSGTLTIGPSQYGFYGTPQAVSAASTTAANTTVRVNSPTLNYRVSTTIESAANIKTVTDCTWDWHVDVYTADPQSTIISTIKNEVQDLVLEI